MESNLNPSAIGKLNEQGLFQVRYEYMNQCGIIPNIEKGLDMIQNVIDNCPYKDDLTFVTCYNAGVVGARKIKKPRQFSYYKKVMNKYRQLTKLKQTTQIRKAFYENSSEMEGTERRPSYFR